MAIELGAVLYAHEVTPASLATLATMGFSTLNISFWQSLDSVDLVLLADTVAATSLKVSALSVFGNTLMKEETLLAWKTLIRNASLFGSPFVTGFAGRVTGKSVEASLPLWKETFSDLLEVAYQHRCKALLFENCRMGDLWKRGDWNIAINGDAWALMFDTLDDPKLGLQWEPSHQVEAFLDPLEQLRKWLTKIKHIHGKDASIDRALLRSVGLYGPKKAIGAVLPGQGETDWASLIGILKDGGYTGSIDLETEGKDFCSDLPEKKLALEYLSGCL